MLLSFLLCPELIFPYALHRKEAKKKYVKSEKKNMRFSRFVSGQYSLHILLFQDSDGILILRVGFRPDPASKLALLCMRSWSR